MSDPLKVEYRIRAEITSPAVFNDEQRIGLLNRLSGSKGVTYYGPEQFTVNYTVLDEDARSDEQIISDAESRLHESGAAAWPGREFSVGSIGIERLCAICGLEPGAATRFAIQKPVARDSGQVTIYFADGVVRICASCASRKAKLGFCEKDRVYGEAGTRCRTCQDIIPILDPEAGKR